MPRAGDLNGTAMVKERWRKATQKQRRRAIELVITLVLIGAVVWQYGGLAPRVIIVLSYLLSLLIVLVQMPFLAGFYGIRRFRPVLVMVLIALPFLIARGYEAVYGKDLFLIWYGDWLGGVRPSAAALAIAALAFLSYLAGRAGRKMRRP